MSTKWLTTQQAIAFLCIATCTLHGSNNTKVTPQEQKRKIEKPTIMSLDEQSDTITITLEDTNQKVTVPSDVASQSVFLKTALESGEKEIVLAKDFVYHDALKKLTLKEFIGALEIIMVMKKGNQQKKVQVPLADWLKNKNKIDVCVLANYFDVPELLQAATSALQQIVAQKSLTQDMKKDICTIPDNILESIFIPKALDIDCQTVFWAPDNKTIIGVTEKNDQSILLEIDSTTGSVKSQSSLLSLILTGTPPPTFSPNGKFIALSVNYGELEIIDAKTKKPVKTLDGKAPSWSPDSSKIATSFIDGTIHIYETQSWKEKISFATNIWNNYPISTWSSDGKYLIAGTGNQLLIWNTEKNSLVRTIDENIRALWSMNNNTIAYYDGVKFTIYSIESDAIVKQFPIETNQTAALSPNGRYLATFLETNRPNNDISIWSIHTGTIVGSLNIDSKNRVDELSWSPDSRKLACVYYSSSWDEEEDEEDDQDSFKIGVWESLSHACSTMSGVDIKETKERKEPSLTNAQQKLVSTIEKSSSKIVYLSGDSIQTYNSLPESVKRRLNKSIAFTSAPSSSSSSSSSK